MDNISPSIHQQQPEINVTPVVPQKKKFGKIVAVVLVVIVCLVGGIVGYAKYKCPGQDLYADYMSLKLGVNCNDNVAIKVGGQIVGYAVVPGGEQGALKAYDQQFDSGIKANVGADGLAHYSNPTLGVSLAYNPNLFSIVEEYDNGLETAKISVLIKRNADSKEFPSTSLKISSKKRTHDNGDEYTDIDGLLKQIKYAYEGLGLNIFITNLGNQQVVEKEGESFADGKTKGKEYFAFNKDKNIRINYQYIPGDESGKKMEEVLNSIQFLINANPAKNINSTTSATTTGLIEIKSNIVVDLNSKNPNIVTSTYYYPKGVLANIHTKGSTSKCTDISIDIDKCDSASLQDFIVYDQNEILNVDTAPIATSIYAPYPFKTSEPIGKATLYENMAFNTGGGNSIILVKFIQTDGGRSDAFIAAVVFNKNAHMYFPINTYVGKYRDKFVGPFLEEVAKFIEGGNILVYQRNGNIGEKGQFHRLLTFTFSNGIYTLLSEKYGAENLDQTNESFFKSTN